MIRSRFLLLAMGLLQVLWVSAIWTTGVAANAHKLPPLLLYTMVFVYPVLLGCFVVGRQVRQRIRHLR